MPNNCRINLYSSWFVRKKEKITNKEYQDLNTISERTSARELEDLFSKEIFLRVGENKSTHYVLNIGG
jgi:predicted HTH transcriptional regulator